MLGQLAWPTDAQELEPKPPPSARLAASLALWRSRQPGSVGGSLAAPVHTELGEHARDVVLDSLFRQVEAVGDLPVRQTLGDEVENTPFLIRETLEAFVASGPRPEARRRHALSSTGR